MKDEHGRKTVADAEGAGAAANELPAFVDEDGLFLRAVGFGFIPHEIQSYEHADRQQIAAEFRDVQHRELVIQIHIGLLVEGAGRAVYKAVDDVGKAFGIALLPQNVVEVAQHRHLAVNVGVIRITERSVIMGDTFPCVGTNQGIVQKLFFLIGHIGDQQGKEDMKPLNFCCQLRAFDTGAIRTCLSCVSPAR